MLVNIWKLTINSPDIILYTDWIDTGTTLEYIIGIKNSAAYEIITNYFRPYLCTIEFFSS